ncbi:DUF1000-domain-containing protein [Byssothecium circinans]|uniref:DUF1000-domain-containing protein n=1 Tax=Byssothecium circinans TaxID=147558 RepID=A0A6A5T7J9_9PLEO|nr:DUF1000-domain-containing protein [Byssothecium circinans]
MSHHHDHSHHGHDDEHAEAHNHVHDHDDDIVPALQNLLYEQIDFSKLQTLNEDEADSGRKICQKTWAQRMDPQPELKSFADEQLLMIVPFTGQVRLHSILLRTSPTPSSPRTLKLFINDELDFSSASEKPATQTLSVSQTAEVQEIPVKRALFNTTRVLTLFFEDNWSRGEEDETRISYLGFKGDFMKLSKEPINFLYEAAANPGDHKMVAGVKEGLGRSVQ